MGRLFPNREFFEAFDGCEEQKAMESTTLNSSFGTGLFKLMCSLTPEQKQMLSTKVRLSCELLNNVIIQMFTIQTAKQTMQLYWLNPFEIP